MKAGASFLETRFVFVSRKSHFWPPPISDSESLPLSQNTSLYNYVYNLYFGIQGSNIYADWDSVGSAVVLIIFSFCS